MLTLFTTSHRRRGPRRLTPFAGKNEGRSTLRELPVTKAWT